MSKRVSMFAVALVGLFCSVFAPAKSSGQLGGELHFVEQCRVLDTRPLGGPIANGAEYGFKVRGQVGGTQGGTATCGVPVEATGVVLNVTVVGASGPGWAEAYPFSQRPPLPNSRINYATADTIANEIIVALLPWSSGTNEVAIRPAVSPTHLAVDAIGYFTETRRGPAEVISATLVGVGQTGIVYDVQTTSGLFRCDPRFLGAGSNVCGTFAAGSCVFATGHPIGTTFFPHTIVQAECP